MKTNKGMTLVEILVAFFLLSIITVMFGQVVMRELKLMQDSRRLTANILSAAKEAEQTMQYYRNFIYSTGNYPAEMAIDLIIPKPWLFGREVICYKAEVEVKDSGGAFIYCVETDQKPTAGTEIASVP